MGSAVESLAREGPAGPAASLKMDQNASLTITDRKKSLEANTSVPAVKTVKVEYASNFSIKPLIDFFNRTFRRDTFVDESTIKESINRKGSTEALPECDTNDAAVTQNQTFGEEVTTPDSLSNSSSFVSCCSRFDLSDNVSLYYSFDELSCSSEVDEDVFDLEVDPDHDILAKHPEAAVPESSGLANKEENYEQEDEDLIANFSQLQPHEDDKPDGFMGSTLEKSNFNANKLDTQEVRGGHHGLCEPKANKQVGLADTDKLEKLENFIIDENNENCDRLAIKVVPADIDENNKIRHENQVTETYKQLENLTIAVEPKFDNIGDGHDEPDERRKSETYTEEEKIRILDDDLTHQVDNIGAGITKLEAFIVDEGNFSIELENKEDKNKTIEGITLEESAIIRDESHSQDIQNEVSEPQDNKDEETPGMLESEADNERDTAEPDKSDIISCFETSESVVQGCSMTMHTVTSVLKERIEIKEACQESVDKTNESHTKNIEDSMSDTETEKMNIFSKDRNLHDDVDNYNTTTAVTVTEENCDREIQKCILASQASAVGQSSAESSIDIKIKVMCMKEETLSQANKLHFSEPSPQAQQELQISDQILREDGAEYEAKISLALYKSLIDSKNEHEIEKFPVFKDDQNSDVEKRPSINPPQKDIRIGSIEDIVLEEPTFIKYEHDAQDIKTRKLGEIEDAHQCPTSRVDDKLGEFETFSIVGRDDGKLNTISNDQTPQDTDANARITKAATVIQENAGSEMQKCSSSAQSVEAGESLIDSTTEFKINVPSMKEETMSAADNVQLAGIGDDTQDEGKISLVSGELCKSVIEIDNEHEEEKYAVFKDDEISVVEKRPSINLSHKIGSIEDIVLEELTFIKDENDALDIMDGENDIIGPKVITAEGDPIMLISQSENNKDGVEHKEFGFISPDTDDHEGAMTKRINKTNPREDQEIEDLYQEPTSRINDSDKVQELEPFIIAGAYVEKLNAISNDQTLQDTDAYVGITKAATVIQETAGSELQKSSFTAQLNDAGQSLIDSTTESKINVLSMKEEYPSVADNVQGPQTSLPVHQEIEISGQILLGDGAEFKDFDKGKTCSASGKSCKSLIDTEHDTPAFDYNNLHSKEIHKDRPVDTENEIAVCNEIFEPQGIKTEDTPCILIGKSDNTDKVESIGHGISDQGKDMTNQIITRDLKEKEETYQEHVKNSYKHEDLEKLSLVADSENEAIDTLLDKQNIPNDVIKSEVETVIRKMQECNSTAQSSDVVTFLIGSTSDSKIEVICRREEYLSEAKTIVFSVDTKNLPEVVDSDKDACQFSLEEINLIDRNAQDKLCHSDKGTVHGQFIEENIESRYLKRNQNVSNADCARSEMQGTIPDQFTDSDRQEVLDTENESLIGAATPSMLEAGDNNTSEMTEAVTHYQDQATRKVESNGSNEAVDDKGNPGELEAARIGSAESVCINTSVPTDWRIIAPLVQVQQAGESSSSGQDMAGPAAEYEGCEAEQQRKELKEQVDEDITQEILNVVTEKNDAQNDIILHNISTVSCIASENLPTLIPIVESSINSSIQHSSQCMEEDPNDTEIIKNAIPDVDSRIVKNELVDSACDIIDGLINDENARKVKETSRIYLAEDCGDLSDSVLPDIIKSTSQGNISTEEKENKAAHDKEISNKDVQEIQNPTNITINENKDPEKENPNSSDSNEHSHSCISNYDDGIKGVPVKVIETEETKNDDKHAQHQIIRKGSTQTEVSDPVPSKDKDKSHVELNKTNDFQTRLSTDNNDQMIEPIKKDAMPDVVKDQFLECNTIKHEDQQSNHRDCKPATMQFMYQEEDNDSPIKNCEDSIKEEEFRKLSEDDVPRDFLKVRKLAHFERFQGSPIKDSLDLVTAESAAKHETDQHGDHDHTSVVNYKPSECKTWSDCNSVCSTTSSLPDSEGNIRRYSKVSIESRLGTDTASNKKPWNYGGSIFPSSISSSSLMEQSMDSELARQLSEKMSSSQMSKGSDENEFHKKPWNFGARSRSEATSTPFSNFSESEENLQRRCSERRRSSELTRRATLTDFDRKPWNYGAWRDRRSVSTFTQLARSCQVEEGSERRSSSQVTRRATMSEFDKNKRPWNYGPGVTKYKKLFNFLENKKSVA